MKVDSNARLLLAKEIRNIRAKYIVIVSHYVSISATVRLYKRECLNVRSVSEMADIVATL
jgi:hypothetical protein